MYRALSSLVLLGACGGGQKPPPAVANCNRIGAVSIAEQADVDRVAACTWMGSLTVRTGAPLDLSPLKVERITGDVNIGPTLAVEELRLDHLREVGGAIRVESNALLHGVFLPQLERTRAFTIEAGSSLATIAAPKLTTVNDSITIDELGSVEILDFSAVETIGGALTITHNPELKLVQFDALKIVKSVVIEANAKLPVDQVEALRVRSPAANDR
ncbi:MAG TPA: hypothetical protein VGM90_18865 [Kofleriaceae bacterium]|jgi:hypothetical protein